MAKRILVVDDDTMNLKMAEFILKNGDYEIEKAESGVACLQLLWDKEYDLVLLDIEMPGKNGIETLEEIRNIKKLENLPVVFLTAAADADTVTAASRLGVKDYIKKPFMPQELLERVEAVLGEV